MTIVEPSTKTTAWLLLTTPAFILLAHYVAAHLAGATAHITSSPSSAPAHPQETSKKDGPFVYSHRPAGELSPNPADPYGFIAALAQLASAWQRYPERMAEAASRYFARLTEVSAIASARAVGVAVPDSTEAAHDRRFSNEFWANNPFFYGLRGAYDALAEYADAVLAIGLEDLDPVVARKAEFAVRAMLDGAAPSNFLFTNPVALERAARTGGTSLAQGYANYLRGLAENRGLPKQVDRGAFIVGEDLAVTPGQVVLRTDLIELIQYAPQTEQVHEIPLLCSPPWINRYYVMDLAPGRSFVEWAVQHGHAVFSISYRNPDESMAATTYDDYVSAARAAIAAIRNITGAPRVNRLFADEGVEVVGASLLG